MSDITNEIRIAIEEASPAERAAALHGLLRKVETLQAQGMPWSAIGDEILIAMGPPLGVPVRIGRFAQLITDEHP